MVHVERGDLDRKGFAPYHHGHANEWEISIARHREALTVFKKKYTKISTFYKSYATIAGIGIMLFGLFVVFFKTYEHPLYGDLNFGEYHVLKGIIAMIIGAAFILFINRKR